MVAAEDGSQRDLAFAQQAEEVVGCSPELLAACSTHSNGWAQPSRLVCPGSLFYMSLDIAPVASPPGPHMSAREVSVDSNARRCRQGLDKQSRFARTAKCWCPSSQTAR